MSIRIAAAAFVAATAFIVVDATGAPDRPTPVTFVDKVVTSRTQDVSFGRGSAMVDLDGDGRLDLITGNAAQPNLVLRQLEDKTFVPMNAEWQLGLESELTWGTIVADFDNDGDPDVVFANGQAGGFIEISVSRLYRNDLASIGRFTDVTEAAGDLAIATQNFGGSTLDYDNDGDLDLFFSNKVPGFACRLLRNDGGLSFSDVSVEAGITHTNRYRHCSVGDYNNDGWLDIGVGAIDGPNRLYHNNGDGTFRDVAALLGVDAPMFNFGFAFEDFNNDGWQDVYLPKWQLEPDGPSLIFLNDGTGRYVDATVGSGLTGQTDMGHNTGDVDLDGTPDIFIGTGAPEFASNDLLLLVTARPDGSLEACDVAVASGITASGPTRCHGIVFGDYDRDGDIDIYINNGGPGRFPETIQGNSFYENEGNGNNWAAFTLVGTRSNRDGIGARLMAVTNTGRELHRMHRSAIGFCNTNPAEVWFGIGDETSIQRVQIRWPSGAIQVITSPAMRAFTEIIEPGAVCETDGDTSAVTITDLLVYLSDWLAGARIADVDNSGNVDIIDLLEFLDCWLAF